MSWEEDWRRRYTCPCGKGEYEEASFSDDWGRSETHRTMLCPECKERYVYDHTIIHGHPGNEIERGWVLKSVLDEEKKYRKNVEVKSKELYYATWQNCFANAKTKKEIWKRLTLNGKYPPSLGTFYSHTQKYGKEELTSDIDRYFNYDDLKRVFEICGIEPDWEYLCVNDEDRKRFAPYHEKVMTSGDTQNVNQ